MADTVRITCLDDVVEWKNALLCLAVGRCEPMLHLVGVPRELASRPDLFQDVAKRFLLEAETLAATTRNPPVDEPVAMRAELLTEPYALGIERLLAQALDELSATYGEATTRELVQWIERHFVDPLSRNRWWLLGMLLSRLVAGNASDGAPLRSGDHELLMQILHEWFGPTVEAVAAARIASARTIPLDPIEQRLVALEVLEPEDPPEVDVVNALELALGEERAYRAWQGVRQVFAPPQRRQMVEWLTGEARSMNIPADLVVQLITPLASA